MASPPVAVADVVADPTAPAPPPECKWCVSPAPTGIQNLLCPAKRQILYRILTLASAPTDGLDPKFYNICKDWCEMIDKKLITEDTFSHTDNKYNYKDIKTINDKLLHSGNFFHLRSTGLPSEIQYSQLLKSATFIKEISSTSFGKMIVMLSPHLQSLTLDQQTLFSLDKTGLECLQQLQQLEVFAISGDFMTEQNFRPLRRDWAHNTKMLIRALASINFPKLIQIAVSAFVVPHSNHDGYIVESFWDCMARHKATLKHVTFQTQVVHCDESQDPKKNPHMPKPNIKQLDGLRLISLFFGGQLSNHLRGTQEIFLSIFESQASKELRYAFCNFSRLRNPLSTLKLSPRKARRYFNKSLTVLELLLRGDTSSEIDCAALFGHCHELRVLALSAGPKREPVLKTPAEGEAPGPELRRKRTPRPQLLNVSSLPKSLQFFRIQRLRIAQADGEFIVWDLPELRFLELVEIGNEDGLGLDFHHFEGLMATHHIDRLIFYHAFNKESMKQCTFETLKPVEVVEGDEDEEGMMRPAYSMQLDAYEKKHGYVCMKLTPATPTMNSQYTIIPNKNVLPSVYYPFNMAAVGAYRPRPAPDSADPCKPEFDWVNNPFLQHALSFHYPLADPGNENCISDSDSSGSEGGDSGSESEYEKDFIQAVVEGVVEACQEGNVDMELEGTEIGEGGEGAAAYEEADLNMEQGIEIDGHGEDAGESEISFGELINQSIESIAAQAEADEELAAEEAERKELGLEPEPGAAVVLPAEGDGYNSDEDEEIKKGVAAIKTFTGGDFFAFRAACLENQAARAREAAAQAQAQAAAVAAAEPEPEVIDSDSESDAEMEAEVEDDNEAGSNADADADADEDADDEQAENSDDSDDEVMYD